MKYKVFNSRNWIAGAAALLLCLLAAGHETTEEVTRSLKTESAEPVTAAVELLENEADGMEKPEQKMQVAITFDDGPHPIYTERLLDGLKERGVKATFFLVGKNAEAYPRIVQRMQEDGHLLGNHTYSHVLLTQLSEEDACRELEKTCEVLEKITGIVPEYVRPPFGNWNWDLECAVSLIPILWTVDSRDWTTTNASEIVGRVVTKTRENDIILMHDYYAASVDAALEIIDQLTMKGFEFVTADELIVN